MLCAKKNESLGFSIIELVVVVAIGSFISLGLMQMLSHQMRSIVMLKDQLEATELKQTLQSILRNNTSCINTLGGINIGPVNTIRNIAEIKNNLDNTVYSSNSPTENLNIHQITLTNLSVGAPSTSGQAELSLPITRTRALTAQELPNIRVGVNVTVNAAGVITSCSGGGSIVINNCYWRTVNLEHRTGMVFEDMCQPGEVMTGLRTLEPTAYWEEHYIRCCQISN